MYLNQCTCEICRLGVEHPEQVRHQHINLVLSRLDEQQRRWFAALLADQYGLSVGGIRLAAKITGLSEKTIRRGLGEICSDLAGRPYDRQRIGGYGAVDDPDWEFSFEERG